MNQITKTEPIPWEHKTSNLVSSWVWDTEHFTVTIFAEGMSTRQVYNWKIMDKTSGRPRIFDSGAEIKFSDATTNILETISKGYPRVLGYGAYAGSIATTFQIYDGKKYDFAPAIGENVLAKIMNNEGSEITATGMFDIQNYDFTLTSGDSVIIVPPLKVVDVLKEYGMVSLIKTGATAAEPERSRSGRIVYEPWRKGCTGKPGFRPGTTTHPPNGPYCSIHHI